MSQLPTPNGGPNQTLLELIYALKGLAQTVEFYHTDLSRLLEEEKGNRQREFKDIRAELDRVRDIAGKNSQALAVLPITVSDRMEKLISRIEKGVDDRVESALEDVHLAITEVGGRLSAFVAVRAGTRGDGVPMLTDGEDNQKADITGRIEITKEGQVRMAFNSSLLKKIWAAIMVLAAGGGAYGIVEAIKSIFGW